MTTSMQAFTTVAGQARQATEKSVEMFKQSAKAMTDNPFMTTLLPSVDLVTPVEQYFEFVRRSVDVSGAIAVKWAEAVYSMTGMIREQAGSLQNVVEGSVESVGSMVEGTVESVTDLTAERAERAEQAANELAKKAKAAERAEAKRAHEQAREPYEDLTKVELSEMLVQRELPKSGTVDELIERLVHSDSK